MAKRVSFFKKKKIEKRISFRSANGKFVSFTAKVPSKKRTKITFFATKKAKIMVRSRRRGGRNNEIIVDGITARINSRILNSGEKILEDCGLKETLEKAVERKPIIYTLYKGDEIYYVGQSDRGSLARVRNHTRDRHKGR